MPAVRAVARVECEDPARAVDVNHHTADDRRCRHTRTRDTLRPYFATGLDIDSLDPVVPVVHHDVVRRKIRAAIARTGPYENESIRIHRLRHQLVLCFVSPADGAGCGVYRIETMIVRRYKHHISIDNR